MTELPVVVTNTAPLREVRKLLRSLEALRIRSEDPAIAATSVSFTWGRASVDVAFTPPRCFEVNIRSSAPLATTPEGFGWSGAGGRRHARWPTAFAETAAGRIGRVVGDIKPGKRRLQLTLPTTVSVSGESVERWLERRLSPVTLQPPAKLASLELATAAAEPEPSGLPLPRIPLRALGSGPDGSRGTYGAVLGWPTAKRGLHEWCRDVEPITKRARQLLGPPPPSERLTSPLSSSTRLDAAAAAGVRARIADALAADDDPYRSRAGAAVTSSGVVLLGAPAAEALFESEQVPDEWMADIRLPLPIITVLMSAPFRVPPALVRVANSDPAPVGWFGRQVRRLDTSCLLVGFTIFGADDDTLDGHVLWHVHANGDLVSVPALFRRSRIGHIVPKTAAWLSTHRPLRGAAQRRSPRQPQSQHGLRRSLPSVVEIRIQRHSEGRSNRSTSGHGVEAHLRRGHWRRQRIGPHNDWHYELRWIAPTVVGGVLPLDQSGRVYSLPE